MPILSTIARKLGLRLPTPLEMAVSDLQEAQRDLLIAKRHEEQFHHAANLYQDRITRLRYDIEQLTKEHDNATPA